MHNRLGNFVPVCFGLAMVVLLCGVAEVPGQPPRLPRPSYVEIPVHGDFEEILKGLLSQVENRQKFKGELQKLLDGMKEDPPKLPLEPGQLENLKKQMDLSNPLVQQHLKDLLNRPDLKQLLEPTEPGGLPIDQKQFNAFKKMLQGLDISKFKPPQVKSPDPDIPPPGPGEAPPLQSPPESIPLPKPKTQDGFGNAIKSLVKDLAKSEVGKAINEDDDFKKMLFDLSQSPSAEGEDFFGTLVKDMAKWVGEQKASEWNSSLPKFEGWNLGDMSMPSVSLPNMNVHMPTFGGSSVPAMGEPSPDALATILLAVFVIFVIGVLLWSVLRVAPWSPLNRRPTKLGWPLGPWPINPTRIRTAAELILAFNYLSLLLCGPVARTWNHRKVAHRLGEENSEHRDDAANLAAMYEQARYAPINEPLSDEELQQARQCLRALAGAKGQ